MTEEVDNQTLRYLDSLVARVKELALQQKHIKDVNARIERHYSWNFEDFEYSHSGIRVSKAGRFSSDKENLWTRTFNTALPVLCLDEYKVCDEFIKKSYPAFNIPLALRSFAFRIFYTCLRNHSDVEREIEAVKSLFLAELNNRPLAGEAVVFLIGITLESQEIHINDLVKLRRTKKEDFEGPSLYDMPLASLMPFNTVVLTIRCDVKGRTLVALQQQVETYMFLLKVFCLGSVQYKEYKFNINNIAAFPGANGNVFSDRVWVWQNYYLRADDEPQFIQTLNNFKVPEKFLSHSAKVDYLTTAFDRYKEAITENSTFEKRVSTAVMGVEALLNNDPKELSFKLATRTSKLLACFGFDAIAVRGHLGKAYNIRSKFAHGGYLSQKELDKLSLEFKNFENLALTILNYLRIIFITSVHLNSMSKNQLIESINDALIDEDSAETLKVLLAPVAQFVF